MSLKQKLKKIKGFLIEYSRPVFWLSAVLLTIADSYMLGYISKIDEVSGLELQFNEEVEITIDDLNTIFADSVEGSIVASKNGTKYYFSWCSGVGRINEENKIYFSSEEAAIGAGYSKSKNCE